MLYEVITALEDATIRSESTAASVAVASAIAAAGSGAESNATIHTITRAYADPVELDVAGGIDIHASATDAASATAVPSALALAAS